MKLHCPCDSAAILVLAFIIFLSGCTAAGSPPRMGELGSAHLHADFKVYMEGEQVDFSQDKYQVSSKFAHVEDNKGDVIHFHAKNTQLGFFFSSLNMTLSKECFTIDDGSRFCNSGQKQLSMYVNRKKNTEFGSYIPKDCDRILVSYGTEEEIPGQLASVTSRGCK